MPTGYGFSSRVTGIYTYLECKDDKCYYCGDVSVLHDHVLPLAVYKLAPIFKWPSELLKLVPCCHSCNVIASNRVFMSLSAKWGYIQLRRLR